MENLFHSCGTPWLVIKKVVSERSKAMTLQQVALIGALVVLTLFMMWVFLQAWISPPPQQPLLNLLKGLKWVVIRLAWLIALLGSLILFILVLSGTLRVG